MVKVPSVGFPELLIVLVVIALLFGASRLPKLARSVGQSAKEFRKGLEDGAEDEDDDDAKGSSRKSKKAAKEAASKTPDSDAEDE